MIGDEVKNKKSITFAEALDILKEKGDAEELKFEQRLAYDYLQKFSQLSPKKTKKLVEELLEIEKIRRHQAVVLANNMPKTKEDIRLIFSKERTSLREETIERIVKIIDSYRS